MSPLALGSLISAIVFTVVKLFIAIVETAAHGSIVSVQIGGCITIGAVVGWAAFFSAHCRDTLATKVTGHSTGLHDSVTTAIAAAAENAVEETINRISFERHLAARTGNRDHGVPTPPPRRPHLVP